MIRNLNYQNDSPSLYLIPTPIGNLEDMTYRAVKVLNEVDIVYAEDTRVTKKLLSYYQIDKPLFSLHEHNEEKRISEIIEQLKNNFRVGVVSDAGMPIISDPGYALVSEALKENVNVIALPGPNALLTALVMSGLKPHPFMFFGFLNSRAKKRRDELERIKYYSETLIFYEAIHRIKACLKDMYEVLGERDFVIAREISKTYEEIIRGKLSEYEDLDDLKGELVVIISGYEEDNSSDLTIVEQVDYFINTGMKKTEAMKKVAEMTKKPKNLIYQEYLEDKIKEDK